MICNEILNFCTVRHFSFDSPVLEFIFLKWDVFKLLISLILLETELPVERKLKYEEPVNSVLYLIIFSFHRLLSIFIFLAKRFLNFQFRYNWLIRGKNWNMKNWRIDTFLRLLILFLYTKLIILYFKFCRRENCLIQSISCNIFSFL